jgi:hypothetical protein
MNPSKETGWHTFLDGGPLVCGLCRLEFQTIADAAAAICAEAQAQAREKCKSVLYAVKGVLVAKYEKVTPMTGPDAGKLIKRRVDTVEKLVRIQAAIYALLPAELLEGIDFEAKNRVMLSEISGRKPWES